jgi:hypothetical protein
VIKRCVKKYIIRNTEKRTIDLYLEEVCFACASAEQIESRYEDNFMT